ncbi:hypothetical protein AAF712_006191 [Marasmius tenuissimus]|uniref:Uncharacterized protein n=1 Tax=Marasmius tenuissimus TaxID=585030 RepID=A0ABR2ZZH2_9AGAR
MPSSLSRRSPLPVLLIEESTVVVVKGYKSQDFSQQWNSTSAKIEVGISGALHSLADVLTTVSLSSYFISAKTGLSRTDTLMIRLYRFIVARGLLVSLVQLSYTIVFVALDPLEYVWLNNRASLRAASNSTVVNMNEIVNGGHDIHFATLDESLLTTDGTDTRVGTGGEMNTGLTTTGCESEETRSRQARPVDPA